MKIIPKIWRGLTNKKILSKGIKFSKNNAILS